MMRDFKDDDGGKLAHPRLTSNEIFDFVQLSSAAYDTSFFLDLLSPQASILRRLGFRLRLTLEPSVSIPMNLS
jgi:hypothetical protein